MNRILPKLLIISDMYPDTENQVNGIFVMHQAQMLNTYYEVMILATYFPAKPRYEYRIEQFPVHRIYFPVPDHFYSVSVLSYRWFVLPYLKQVIRSFRPDLIHVHDCRHFPELYCLAPLLRRYDIPRYLTVHNSKTMPGRIHQDSAPSERRIGILRKARSSAAKIFAGYYQYALRAAYSNWTHVFTVNENLGLIILPWTGNTPISVIGNAIGKATTVTHPVIDNVKTFLSESKFRIVSAGNLKKTKGFDLLLQAIARIPEKGLYLVIVGEGEYRAKLERQIADLGIKDRVLLTGRQENAVFRNLLPLFDAFVLPSYDETFGIVYLEAMAAGLPAAGIMGQGIDGIIEDGINGILLRPRNIEDIVCCIQKLMRHPDFASSIAQAGKQLVEDRYQLEHLCQRLKQVYETR